MKSEFTPFSPLQTARARLAKTSLFAAACFAALGLAAPQAQAQQWPSRPVVVVVPFPAGGNTDTMARLASDFLGKRLGRTFVVENRPTGGGTLAAAQVAQAPADGHTLFFASAGQMIILPALQKVTYDPEKDLTPVSIFGTGPFILGVKSTLPVTNLQEFISYAKGYKDKLNASSAGSGSIGHLTAALMAKRMGVEVVFVPYRGGGPAMAALVAHDTDMYFGNASELISQADGGRIRMLAVSTEKPMQQLPALPPVASVYPGFKTSSWNGFLVASGTPKEIISKLESEVRAAAQDPTIRSRLEALGIEPVGNTSAEFAAVINSDRPFYQEAIEAAGLKRTE